MTTVASAAIMRATEAAVVERMAQSGARPVLAATCLGMLALGVNGTAIMAALPTMRGELSLSGAQVEWAINAYLVAAAACVIPGGKAGDRFGSGRAAMAGLALFAAASVIVALAPDAVLLLYGRALQGLAAAMAVPTTLAAVSQASAPERRGAAVGAWAGFLMLGFSLGPLIGGALTHYVDWRAIFWTSSACMVVAAACFAIGGARETATRPRTTGRPDIAGFVLLAVFMTALVAALHALPTVTRATVGFAIPAALAALAFVALLAVERRAAAPLVDLGLFRQAAFVRATVLAAIAMSCVLALLLFYNIDAQSPAGLGLTPVGAGLSLLPMSGGLLAFAFAAPAIIRRFGARRTVSSGMVLVALAAVGIAIAAQGRLWTPLMFGLFAIGVGLALPYATGPRLALAALPPDQAGSASGVINACTFLGGSIGVAAGAIGFAFGGLPGTMGLIALLGLAGAWLGRALPASAA